MIKIRNLCKTFKSSSKKLHSALVDINLEIAPGDVFGIIGLSGAGKSTLMRCITRLEKPSSGKIFINDTEFTALEGKELLSARKSIGMVFQHFNLLSSRTVAENIAFPMELSPSSIEEKDNRVDELLKLVHLEHKKFAYPTQLSGGEKQRVGIARALANKPHLLLCDEATSALDPKSTSQILDLLKSLNKELGLTILLITHEMDVIKAICNKVAVIEKGSIVEDGLVTDVFARPHHPTTKEFLEHSTHLLTDDFLKISDPKKRLFRLCFNGPKAEEPIISNMIKKYAVDVSILLGGIDCLQNTIVGTLTLEFSGQDAEIERALSFLKENEIVCEEIKK